jgi:hypothetical protein
VSDATSWTPARADERAHPPGTEPLWAESWSFDWAVPDGSLGGYVRLGLQPDLGRAWYWACLVGEDRPLVTVIDHDVPLPRTGLEVRAEGLWADHNVETAFDHWSLGCEAFAVGVDDPAEVYGDLRGERVPFGFDLEWETHGDVVLHDTTTGYEIACRVSGEVLVGHERIEVDGVGQRDHSWGVRDWWSSGWFRTAAVLEDGTRLHATHATGADAPLATTGCVQPPGGPLLGTHVVDHGQELGREGFPTSGWVAVDAGEAGLRLDVEPVAFAPVLLEAPDGRRSRLPRALCRFTAPDGRAGVGWSEWNQPG